MATTATHAPSPGGHVHHVDPRPLSYWWKRAVLWSVGGVLFSFGLVWLLRNLFHNTPTWEPEVYTTAAAFIGSVSAS